MQFGRINMVRVPGPPSWSEKRKKWMWNNTGRAFTNVGRVVIRRMDRCGDIDPQGSGYLVELYSVDKCDPDEIGIIVTKPATKVMFGFPENTAFGWGPLDIEDRDRDIIINIPEARPELWSKDRGEPPDTLLPPEH